MRSTLDYVVTAFIVAWIGGTLASWGVLFMLRRRVRRLEARRQATKRELWGDFWEHETVD